MRKSALVPLTLLTLGACGSDPPAPATVRARIASDLGNVLHASVDAGDGASKMLPTGSFGLLEKLIGGGDGGGVVSMPLFAPTPDDESATDELDPDTVIDKLNTQVFTDANEVEPGVYIVPADLACMDGSTMMNDPDCVASWDKLDLRLRVVEDGGGLAFAVQLDANHDEPLEIGLTHTSLSVSVDLDAAGSAAQAIAMALGEEAPNARLHGKVTGVLHVLGTAHVSLGFQIDRAVSIAVADQGGDLDGADAFRLTSDAAHVFDIDLDGGTATGTASLALAATTVHIPGDDAFDLDLPGATAQAHVAAGGALQIDNIGLGDRTTTLSKNGALGLSIDVNPADGRAFSATVTPDTTAGIETLAVTPKVDVRITEDRAVLGDTSSPYDLTRVYLLGSLEASEDSDQVRVASGEFAIGTNPASYGFTATAGQCVSNTEAYDADTDGYYTQWSAGVCQ